MTATTAPARTEKRCRGCGAIKSVAEFGRRSAASDGLLERCKPCIKVARADYYSRNREQVLASAKRWREANPDTVLAGVYAWKSANPAKVKRYRRTNYERNRDSALAQCRAWQAANPDKVAEISKRRRARLASASIGEVDLTLLWESQGGLCGICGQAIDPALKYPDPMSRSVDHIVPLSKGGAHEQPNLQWAHLVENQQKGATVPDSLSKGHRHGSAH